MSRLSRQLADAVSIVLSGGTPRVPEAGAVLWAAFCSLQRGRTSHGAGPNPITWEAIAEWARVTGWPLAPRHVEVLRAMDDAYLAHFVRGSSGARSAAPEHRGAITPALFDALLGA